MTAPDVEGRAALLAAAAELRPYQPPTRRKRWPRPPARLVVLFLAADLVIGSALWMLVGRHQDSPVDAVTTVAALAGNGDWTGVYDHLCSADRAQFSEADVAAGGDGALQLLHGFAGVRVTDTRTVAVRLVGPIGLPAEQVSGQLDPGLGSPVAFTVTTVRELAGWRLCLSAGGYSAPAFGVDVPLGG